MFNVKQFKNSLRTFAAEQSGNVGILVGLAALPMLLATGAAIDLSRYNATEIKVQAALDAAALTAAAASDVSTAQRITIAENTFKANIVGGASSDVGAVAKFKVENGMVISSATGKMQTSLMKLAGISTMDLNLQAEVNVATKKKAEIVLVLDYSGSMKDAVKGGTKYKIMSAAAIKLVSDFKDIDKDRIKVGLVPFSHYVYASLPGSEVLGGGVGTWSGCTQDRPAPANMTDSASDGSDDSKWGQPINPEHASSTCADFVGNNLKIVPLTNDYSRVTAQLASMKPSGWTHLALGMEFGYQLISHGAPYTEAVEFGDKETEKFVVMLTDGSQTEKAKGPGGVNTVAQGEKNLETLCENVKGNGVTVITVAFDLTDKDPKLADATKARLRDCSTGGSNYFDANDSTDVGKAFDSVRQQVTASIFLSK